jgi:phage tail-like protein
MATANPIVSAWFGVEFQGQVVGAFRECTGLGSENEVVEYKASGPKGEYVVRKVPGRMKWNNITLKRGITDAMDMWKWRALVEQGNVTEARKNGSIVMYDSTNAEVARFNFTNGWPSKISTDQLSVESNDPVKETITLTVESLARVK